MIVRIIRNVYVQNFPSDSTDEKPYKIIIIMATRTKSLSHSVAAVIDDEDRKSFGSGR